MHIIIEVEIKLLIDLQINDNDKYQYSEHLTVHFAKPISVDELKMPEERTGQQTEVKLRVWALGRYFCFSWRCLQQSLPLDKRLFHHFTNFFTDW